MCWMCWRTNTGNHTSMERGKAGGGAEREREGERERGREEEKDLLAFLIALGLILLERRHSVLQPFDIILAAR